MESVTIIGPGRIGGALAISLARRGYRIDQLVFRKQREDAARTASLIEPPPGLSSLADLKRVDSDLILIATSDASIADVALSLLPVVTVSSAVLHTSGALTSNELSVLRENGVAVGSLHPLVAVSEPISGADLLSGAYFCLEGDEAAVEAASRVVYALGGTQFTVSTASKPLYHAGAVMAAGHLVSLIDMSIGILVAAGIEKRTATNVLLPLVESSIKNLRTQNTHAALTGPFARGDAQTIESHIAAMDNKELRAEKEVYLDLGLRALELSEQNGTDRTVLQPIRELLIMAKLNSK